MIRLRPTPPQEPERRLEAGFRVCECQKPVTDRRSSKLVQGFKARTFGWENSHPERCSWTLGAQPPRQLFGKPSRRTLRPPHAPNRARSPEGADREGAEHEGALPILIPSIRLRRVLNPRT